MSLKTNKLSFFDLIVTLDVMIIKYPLNTILK